MENLHEREADAPGKNGGESCNSVGKVWLVGAGPADPGLITLKGRQVLREADTVVYDALVGEGILAMIPETAETVYVGKRAGHHTLPQEEISAVLARKAKEGKRVVRLKGGDPFLFGRGGEEIEVLLQEKIPFEVIPGVTSALSVPAYQGIPVTHRDYCSSLHIITGHKRTGECLDIDFGALVRTKGTLVFLMGVTALGDICQGLLLAGMEPDMPAALLMRGTTAAQRRVTATVSTLEREVEKAGACTPAIIVVGKVCALSERFGWYEKQPLGGVKVLLTRPADRIGETAAALRREGAEVLEMPAIRTVPIADNKALDAAFSRIGSYSWIVFTSSAGVRCFFRAMASHHLDFRALSRARFAVIGPGTAKALEEYGFYADLMPEIYDAEHLGRALCAACGFAQKSGGKTASGSNISEPGAEAGDSLPGISCPKAEAGDSLPGGLCPDFIRILIPRARNGSPELLSALMSGVPDEHSLQADDIPVYDTVYERSRFVDPEGEFTAGDIDYALFTSASTVRGFAAAAPGLDYRLVRAVCIGKQTAAAAEALGMQVFVSKQATIASLVERVKELHARAARTADRADS